MSREERARSFGAHAASYERGRPEYPLDAARWLVPGRPRLIVELGAGTGKLTRTLATLGPPVLAIEPDERMRAVLDSLGLDRVESSAGSAESIPAADGEAGAVVVGSAFHWFDLAVALPEIARVLGPGGTLGFAWNRRDEESDVMRRLVDLMRPEGPPRSWAGERPWDELVAAGGLFEPVERASFAHDFVLPRDAIGDLVRSYSRIGLLPPVEQQAVAVRARELVESATDLHDGPDIRLPYVVLARRTTVR